MASTVSVAADDSGLVFHLDFIAKTAPKHLSSLFRLWGADGVFIRLEPTEVKDSTVPHYVDLLVKFALRRPLEHWRPGADRIREGLLHIEAVAELLATLRARVGWYKVWVETEYDYEYPVRQALLVMADVPMENRPRRFYAGRNRSWRREYIAVYYIDEIPLHLLSAEDQKHPIALSLAIMQVEGDPRDCVREAMRAVEQWSAEADVQELRMVLICIAKRCGLMQLVGEIAVEEKMENEWKYHPEQREETLRMMRGWLENPLYREFLDQVYIDPALKRGEKRGEERGEERGLRSAHVAALLRLLRERSIELSSRQKRMLQRRPCEKLPGIEVALHAKDADDFVQRAGLTRKSNGSGNGHGT